MLSVRSLFCGWSGILGLVNSLYLTLPQLTVFAIDRMDAISIEQHILIVLDGALVKDNKIEQNIFILIENECHLNILYRKMN